MDTVMRDQEFYEDTAGGVTISGGEPLCQIEFTHALLAAAKDAGLHTALDTSGYGPTEHLARVLPLTDLLLFDLKADPESHQALTGVPIDSILTNLRWLAENHARLWLRVPVVPGVNATPAHLDQLCRIARSIPEIERIDLLPYHALGSGKWGRMGLSSPSIPTESAHDDALISAWGEALRGTGAQVHIHSHPYKSLD
jgi:pyruvate formate lyase activating enzyme